MFAPVFHRHRLVAVLAWLWVVLGFGAYLIQFGELWPYIARALGGA